MARARIKINEKGLNEVLSRQAVRDELARLAAPIAEQARAGAPVESGEYRDGVGYSIVDGWVRPRARIFVGGDEDKAMGIEARTGNLMRAGGGKFKPFKGRGKGQT